MNKICQDNPFQSHEISPIVIQGSLQAKNGSIVIYGNANATEDGQNGFFNGEPQYNHPYLMINYKNKGIISE